MTEQEWHDFDRQKTLTRIVSDPEELPRKYRHLTGKKCTVLWREYNDLRVVVDKVQYSMHLYEVEVYN